MAKVYSPNQSHNCDYGIDFYYGVAIIPDSQTALLAQFTTKGYTIVSGVDVLSPWDYYPVEELARFAPLIGIDPTGMSKQELTLAIEEQWTGSFEQVIISNTWNIPRISGKYPSVTIFDSDGDQVFGDVFYPDNYIQLVFSREISGIAYFN